MDAMNTPSTTYAAFWRASCGVSQSTLAFALHATRLTVFAVLAVFEPIIRVTLSLLAILMIGVSLFNRYVIHTAHFPFWLMMGLAAGSAVVLIIYYRFMRILAP
jgi:hypothetical protein